MSKLRPADRGVGAPDGGEELAAIVAAAAAVDLPLTVVAVGDDTAGEVYGRRLVLVRPDGYVAWRGDALPDDVAALLDAVRGA